MKRYFIMVTFLCIPIIGMFRMSLFAETRYHIIDPEILKEFLRDEKKEEPEVTEEPSEPVDTYSPEEWNNMRRSRETGSEYKIESWDPYRVQIDTSAVTGSEVDKAQRAFDVELAYESGLSIQGTKTIDVTFSQKRYINDDPNDSNRKKSVNSFEMDQTLRVDIQGKVGRKITVDVHFDDTQENKRDISVVYKGDPEEVVQEAAFGDINLSLPQTEYVNYNKQVFGIKTDLKYKMLRFMAIGSRTKGITETKVFTGQTLLKRPSILDTSYLKMKYYKLFHNDLRRDSIQIWLDDKNPNNNENEEALTQVKLYNSTITLSGFFEELKTGVDFTYEPTEKVIIFKRNIKIDDVIAVNYMRNDGTFLSSDVPVVLKDAANTSSITREMKNYYSLGEKNIMRDNNRGNFTFQIQDLSQKVPEILRNNKPVPLYPENVEIKWDEGIFFFKKDTYTIDEEYLPFPADVYTSNQHSYNIFVEFYSLVKEYTLRPSIVPGSERVVVDGVTLARDVDYYIIYEIGRLTFYDEDRISDNSKIEVTYEYAPFGGQFGQTLVGTRLELSPLKNLFVGSSVLYNFSAKTAQVPDMKSQPDSTLVWDVDGRVEDLGIDFFPVRIKSIKGEFAQSIYNPNIFGKAVIESMEGMKDEDSLSTGEDFWLRAANPSGSLMRYDAIVPLNEDVKVSEIYLGIGAQSEDIWWEEEDEQQVLTIDYDLTKSDADEASLVQVLSKSGRDFSQKLFLETIFYDDGKGETLTFQLGQFSEDIDGDGTFLETEDTNRNGVLDKGEDIGWEFTYPGAAVRVEPGNGRIENEDLDNDGEPDTDTVVWTHDITSQGYAGWRYESIELDIGDTESQKDPWRNIKQLRLVVSDKYGTATTSSGRIRIARVSVAGNRRDIPAPVLSNTITDTSMMVSAVNNQDNPDYDSLLDNPLYNELYPDSEERQKEQALKLEYVNFGADTDGYVSLNAGSVDVSRHRKLKFFVYNNDANKKDVYVRFGSESSYFEFVISYPDNAPRAWELYEVVLEDMDGDDVADRMIYGNTSKKGRQLGIKAGTMPSLKAVSNIIIGVRNTTGSGSILVNEFFVDTAVKQVGHAATLSGDFDIPGWATFGGIYREKDRNFRTITASVIGQDSYDESGHVSLTRLKFMPMNFRASKSKTRTPAAIETGTSNIISKLDEGIVENIAYGADTTLTLRHLPQLSGDVSKDVKDSSTLERKDTTEKIGGSLQYTTPVQIQTPIVRIIPESISARYSRMNYWIEHDIETAANINSLEYTDTYNGSLSFTPWKNFSVKPSYDLAVVRETKFYNELKVAELNQGSSSPLFDAQRDRKIDYPKSLRQTVRGDVNITLLRWLKPDANYTYTANANYTVDIATTVAAVQAVDRTSTGKISWSFNPKEFYGLGGFTPLKSMNINSTYSISDGDSYLNLPRDEYLQNNFWVRKPLNKAYTDYEKITSTSGVIVINAPRRKSLTIRDTQNYIARWNPLDWVDWLEGPLEPLKTISTTNALTKSKEKTDDTGTITDVISKTWPNIDITMNNIERILFTQSFMDSTRLNGKYYKKIVNTVNKSERFEWDRNGTLNFKLCSILDTYLSYKKQESEAYDITTSLITGAVDRIRESATLSLTRTGQVSFNVGVWRFTPAYSESRNQSVNRQGAFTTDKKAQGISLKIRGDLHKPKTFRFPFTGIGFLMKNRMILDSGISWDTVRSPELNVTQDNTDTGKGSLTADYELSSNIRIKFGISYTMFRNKEQKEDDYDEYAGNAGLTIQF